MNTALATPTWTAVCAVEDLVPGWPVTALVDHVQIAVVRLRDGSVHALSNWDPFAKAMVLARGIVGDLKGEPMLTSPIYKQHFALRSGLCLDDPTVSIPIYPVRIVDGQVEIAAP